MTGQPEFVVVGVLARVDQATRDATAEELESLSGVSTFDVGDEYKLGVLIESSTVDEAKGVFEQQIETTPGVLAAWPVFIHEEEEPALVQIQDTQGELFERSEVL